MSIKNVVIRFFLIVMCLVFTAGIIYLLITIENEKAGLQEEMHKLALSKKGLTSVVTFLEESNANLEKKLKNSDRKIREAISQYEEEKRKSATFARKIEEKEAQVQEKEADIEGYREGEKRMSKKLKLINTAFSEIKLEYDDLADAKEEVEKELEDLDRIVKDLSRKDSTPLGTVIIR